MTDSASDDEQSTKLNLKFKTTTETFSFEAKENSSIIKIRKLVSEKLNHPLDKICLIFSGKILKDHDTLSQHRIGDGMVIHVVIRQQPNKTETGSSSSNQPAEATNSTPNQSSGVNQLLNNDVMRQMLNSPMMQGLLDNPDVIRSMFAQNPQIQQLIQNNPEIGHFLNDPQIIRESMEIIRNPTRLNELMRNHDQAVRNLQGIPGGEAALQRLYQDVQEPLLNSTLGSLNTNPFSTQPQPASQNSQDASRSQRAGVENAEALPNPWSNIVNAQRNPPNSGPASDQNQDGSQPNQQAGSEGPAFGLLNAPGMQSLFRQLSANPSVMQNLMSPENMQQFSNIFAQNPGIIQQLLPSMPSIPGVSRSAMEQTVNMMSNPEVARLLSNTRVLNALTQIQQAVQVLQQEAPQLLQNAPNLLSGLGLGLLNQATTTPAPTGNNSNIPLSGNPLPQPTDNSEQQQPPNAAAGFGFAELMNQMMHLNPGSNLPPEQRFRAQLEQLVSMGFTDQQRNIEALLETFGDVSAAIERLLLNN